MRARGDDRLRALGAGLALGLALGFGCDRGAPGQQAPRLAESSAVSKAGAPQSPPPPEPTERHGAPAAVVAPSASDGTGSARPPPAPRSAGAAACRVMSVTGSVQRAGAELRPLDVLDTRDRLELGPVSTLHLVHTASARQWTLSGPALAFACDGGTEEIVLARGTVRAEPGSGVRPGAEVWVGTPFGTLRYADARAEIRVTSEALRVDLSNGSLWWSPLGGEGDSGRELKRTTTFLARDYGLASDAAAAQCERAAGAAEALAKTLRSGSLEALGARAREHVRARQRAHATCSAALAALLASEAEDEQSRAKYLALARYDRQWRSVPE